MERTDSIWDVIRKNPLEVVLCLVLGLAVLVCWAAGRRDRPDVFGYVIDALRPDHLGCYGYPRATSPELDAFAADATLFEEAYTAANWTKPAVASLLTGLYPSAHGTLYASQGIAPWPTLLPEVFQAAEYATCAVSTNVNMSRGWGFDRGFQRFRGGDGGPGSGVLGGPVYIVENAWANRQVQRFLDQHEPKERVFVYVHTVEPHAPYAPQPESFDRFDRGLTGACDGSVPAMERVGVYHPELSDDGMGHLLDLYDAQVWEADRAFGKFLAMSPGRDTV